MRQLLVEMEAVLSGRRRRVEMLCLVMRVRGRLIERSWYYNKSRAKTIYNVNSGVQAVHNLKSIVFHILEPKKFLIFIRSPLNFG